MAYEMFKGFLATFRLKEYTALEDSLAGKTVLITGGSNGIGKINVRQFAELGAEHIYVLGRNRAKTEEVIESVSRETGHKNIHFVECDTASLASTRNAVQSFLDISARHGKEEPELHLLVCNAGTASVVGLTEDGFENIWQTNFLSHFLMTELLLPTLKRTAEKEGREHGSVRILNVSSVAHTMVKGIDYENVMKPESKKNFVHAYGRSKLAQVIDSKIRAKELGEYGIKVYSLHPGAVATGIWEKGGLSVIILALIRLFFLSEEQGSLTTLYCATSDDEKLMSKSGEYFTNCELGIINPVANDKETQRVLKKHTSGWLELS